MKNYFKVLGVVAIAGALSFQSCETTELDLRTNPNALSADQASPDFLLNQIQLSFAGIVRSMGNYGAELTRIEYMFGKNYVNVYQPSSFQGAWSSAYATLLEDIKAMEVLASEGGLTYHSGIGKFMKAFTMVTLVDYFGDVPYSQANLGAENFNPAVDSGSDIYAAAHALLDSAIADFNADGPAPQNDFYYDGDSSKWVKAANTLKLKMYATTRVHDGSIDSGFSSIIASGNYIDDVDSDFQFTYGTNEVQPDTRHPAYSSDYTVNGGGNYRSISFMNYLQETNDPRRRYYFYRQNAVTPGFDGSEPALETLQCSLQTPPTHYSDGNYPFCGLPNGYWGRDHGNDEGIPPDGFLRTLVGVYPAGGAFDDSRFEALGQGAGAGGNGIVPILLSSSVHFWQAEVALASGNTASAKEHLLAGLAASVEKVSAFGSLDSTADLSTEPTADDISLHANQIGSGFDDDPWNVLGHQFLVSLYGNGSDAYNFYRRTGYPNNLQPNLEPNPGAFIRSMWYPANFVNTNSSVNQKADVTQKVFWDNGSTTLY
jgi:hypothetical protein